MLVLLLAIDVFVGHGARAQLPGGSQAGMNAAMLKSSATSRPFHRASCAFAGRGARADEKAVMSPNILSMAAFIPAWLPPGSWARAP